MVASSKHPPKPRPTIEVEATWLEPSRAGSGGHRRAAVPPPLPPAPLAPEATPPVTPAALVIPPLAPPPLAASAARHNTMPVEAQWLEVTEMDARLRATLPPLPPPDAKTRARMSAPIPREEEDEPPLVKVPAVKKSTKKSAKTKSAKR